MGYTTDFRGSFKINKPLDDETFSLINGLASTRRMKRKGLDDKYGVDGEFYYKSDSSDFGQEEDDTIEDYNMPPSTQPSLWLQWIVNDDKQTIEWDGNEKFYSYIDWIQYLIERILSPKGYLVNGEVRWVGEDTFDDRGVITIVNNDVMVKKL